ncbi:hypothetical protein SHDE107825_19520 [Shewanella denitrificans]
MIVMVVVAVVATVFTAGAAAALMAPALTTAAGGMMAAGAAIMTGGGIAAGFGAATIAAAAFVGGFVGSAASQLVGKAMGVVDSFSLKKALVGGVTSMATAGIATGLREVAGLTTVTNGTEKLSRAGQIWQAGLSVPANVGINQLAGIDTSFSWGNVAVSVLSTAAMTTDTMASLMGSLKLGGSDTASFDWKNTVRDTATGIVGAGASYALGKAILKGADRPSWNFKQVAMNAFGNSVGSEINRSQAKAGINRVEMEKNTAKLAQEVSRKIEARVNAQLAASQAAAENRMTKQLATDTAGKLAAQNQAIEASNEADFERMQNGRQSIAEKANVTSAELKADLAALTERHEAQMFKVNETLANAKMLLGEGTEISLTDAPVPNDVVPRGPGPWADGYVFPTTTTTPPPASALGGPGPWAEGYVFPKESKFINNLSLASDWTSSIAQAGKIASEFGTRSKIINMLSSSKGIPVNALRIDYVKNVAVPLSKAANTYAPITSAKSFELLAKLNGTAVYSSVSAVSKYAPGVYAASQLGSEVYYAVENDLSLDAASRNVGSRALGTAVELGGGVASFKVGAMAGASIGAGIGAFFGGVGAAPGALVGGAVGGVVGTLTYTFSGLGTKVNNAVTNTTREVIGWFNE